MFSIVFIIESVKATASIPCFNVVTDHSILINDGLQQSGPSLAYTRLLKTPNFVAVSHTSSIEFFHHTLGEIGTALGNFLEKSCQESLIQRFSSIRSLEESNDLCPSILIGESLPHPVLSYLRQFFRKFNLDFTCLVDEFENEIE